MGEEKKREGGHFGYEWDGGREVFVQGRIRASGKYPGIPEKGGVGTGTPMTVGRKKISKE